MTWLWLYVILYYFWWHICTKAFCLDRDVCFWQVNYKRHPVCQKTKEETLTMFWRQSTKERRNILNQNGKAFIKNIFADRALPVNHYPAKLFACKNAHTLCHIPSPGFPKQPGSSFLFPANEWFQPFLKASKHSLEQSFACLIWSSVSVHNLTEKSSCIWSEISLTVGCSTFVIQNFCWYNTRWILMWLSLIRIFYYYLLLVIRRTNKKIIIILRQHE